MIDILSAGRKMRVTAGSSIESSQLQVGRGAEQEQQKEVLEDDARKFTVDAIDPQFLEANNATGYLLATDWLETGADNEKKLARKEFSNGEVKRLLISKVSVGGKRTSEKQEISEEQYSELIGSRVCHVEKIRYEFKYLQNGTEFEIKYDLFKDSSLRILEVDSKSSADRELFIPDEDFGDVKEVTGDLQYYGYRVADLL